MRASAEDAKVILKKYQEGGRLSRKEQKSLSLYLVFRIGQESEHICAKTGAVDHE